MSNTSKMGEMLSAKKFYDWKLLLASFQVN
jgi:hypothetical protein